MKFPIFGSVPLRSIRQRHETLGFGAALPPHGPVVKPFELPNPVERLAQPTTRKRT